MKKFFMIVLLASNLISIGFANTKKVETYEDLVAKEEAMRELEKENFEKESVDTYEADMAKEEEAEKKALLKEEKEAQSERELEIVETKDDAGYDENNMDKVREAGHREWDKEQAGFDQPNK